MKSAWLIIRNLLAIVGAIIICGAVGTSDYYVIELIQPVPMYVYKYMVIGAIMMLPLALNIIYNAYKESKQNDNK